MSNIDVVTDPLDDIIQFLDLNTQRQARFINEAFNHRINRSHSASIDAARAMGLYFKSLLTNSKNDEGDQEIRRILQKQWLSLHKAVRFNDLYLRSWPRILINAIDRGNLSLKTRILDLHQSVNIKIRNNSNHGLGAVMLTLIRSSQCFFESIFVSTSTMRSIADYKAFYAFIFEITWRYSSVAIGIPPFQRLPPFHLIPSLSINTDLVDPDAVSNLDRFQMNHGLVVWDPNYIINYSRTRWKTDSLHFYMSRIIELYGWQKSIQPQDRIDTDFRWYLQTEVILKIIDGRDFVKDIVSAKYFDSEMLRVMVNETVHYLRKYRKFTTLNRLLLALRDSNTWPRDP